MTDTHPIRVVFVEDDEDVLLGSTQALELGGFSVTGFGSVEKARGNVQLGAPVVVVCDVKLPGQSGMSWLSEILQIDGDIPVIFVTGHGDISMAVEAMRCGAYDFIEKPCSSEQLVSVVRRAADKRKLSLQVLSLREQLENWRGIQASLVGRSAQMERVRRTVRALAETPADVVIYGETGTGKDLVARCLHDRSVRRHGNFVPLNCGGLSETLAESELFGHEVGSFTGATRRRVGKFEHAHGGTLFLDEIESMPMSVQIKFLRAVQERSIERIGSNETIAADCRVIAASKEDLKALSDQKKFRADLYYRIGVAFIDLPPLRERREDIPLLLEHFLLQAATRFNRPAPVLGNAQFSALMAHSWPGNVRELRNVADRLVLGLLADDSGLESTQLGVSISLPEQLEQFERAVISDELRRQHGDVTATAKALLVPKQTLYDKLRRLHIASDRFRTDE
jgi:two-component system C4-dicarboxylate transport response regulator DctD